MLTPLVVLLSGYGICPAATGPVRNQMLPNARILLDGMQARFGERPPMLVTCFGAASWRMKYSLESDLRVKRPEAGSVPDLFNKIRALAYTPAGKRDLVLIGHSYGGWTAMNIVLNLADLRTRFLGTIDPISLRLCKPQRLTWDWMRWAVGRGARDGNCIRNPRDMEPLYPHIARAAGYWVNAYQSQTGFLHSSAIPEAHENLPRVYPAVWSPPGAHGAIPDDRTIWAALANGILANYPSSP